MCSSGSTVSQIGGIFLNDNNSHPSLSTPVCQALLRILAFYFSQATLQGEKYNLPHMAGLECVFFFVTSGKSYNSSGL